METILLLMLMLIGVEEIPRYIEGNDRLLVMGLTIEDVSNYKVPSPYSRIGTGWSHGGGPAVAFVTIDLDPDFQCSRVIDIYPLGIEYHRDYPYVSGGRPDKRCKGLVRPKMSSPLWEALYN